MAFSKFSNHGVSWVVLQTRGGRGSVHAEGSLIQISLLTLERGVSCPILLSLDDSQDSGAVSPRRVLAVHSADEEEQKPASFDSFPTNSQEKAEWAHFGLPIVPDWHPDHNITSSCYTTNLFAAKLNTDKGQRQNSAIQNARTA